MDERQKWIEQAKSKGLDLEPGDFKEIDGGWTLDGMNPDEWIDAMTMD